MASIMLSLARDHIFRLEEQIKQETVKRDAENNIVVEAREAKTRVEQQLSQEKTRHDQLVAEFTAKFDAQNQILVQARAKRNTSIIAIQAAASAVKELQEEMKAIPVQPVLKQDKDIKKEAAPVAPVAPVGKHDKPVEQASVPCAAGGEAGYRRSFLPPALCTDSSMPGLRAGISTFLL